MGSISEEQKREKKETAIRRSKASGPFLLPTKKLFMGVYEHNDEGGIVMWHCSNKNVLNQQNKQIPTNATEGISVILVLDNSGKGARRIRITGDIIKAELKQEPTIRDAHDFLFLKYPYSPTNHGKTQKVILTFETEDGFDLTHIYETKHGFCEFYRVDPK